jgi:hypothetical protein
VWRFLDQVEEENEGSLGYCRKEFAQSVGRWATFNKPTMSDRYRKKKSDQMDEEEKGKNILGFFCGSVATGK